METFYFRTENMTVGYQGIPLIQQVDLEVKKGEILTLIGPNGAGKSTLLKSMAGQLALLGGTVFLDGQDFLKQAGRDRSRKMAAVFTEKTQPERMTSEEVLEAGRYPYTGTFGFLSPEDHRAVEAAMELVGVTGLRHQDFRTLSDGQRQRVILARAVCQEPEIILLDEPTSYLVVKHKLEFLSTLQKMTREKQCTVILSLHELDLAERISDRILCVKGDRVQKFGTPEEVFVPGYIRELFGITAGSFDEESVSPELPAPEGKPEVFVIGGGGSGRSCYRKLQREGIPFYSGILFQNDLDYPVSLALASETLAAEAFTPVSGELLERARQRLAACHTVYCCRTSFGEWEQANKELLTCARKMGKTILMRIAGENGFFAE